MYKRLISTTNVVAEVSYSMQAKTLAIIMHTLSRITVQLLAEVYKENIEGKI